MWSCDYQEVRIGGDHRKDTYYTGKSDPINWSVGGVCNNWASPETQLVSVTLHLKSPAGRYRGVTCLSKPRGSKRTTVPQWGDELGLPLLIDWVTALDHSLQFSLAQFFQPGRSVIEWDLMALPWWLGCWPCLHKHIWTPSYVLGQTKRLRAANDPFWDKFVNLGIFFFSFWANNRAEITTGANDEFPKALLFFIKWRFICCFSGWKVLIWKNNLKFQDLL